MDDVPLQSGAAPGFFQGVLLELCKLMNIIPRSLFAFVYLCPNTMFHLYFKFLYIYICEVPPFRHELKKKKHLSRM